jgi:hypothetical protein
VNLLAIKSYDFDFDDGKPIEVKTIDEVGTYDFKNVKSDYPFLVKFAAINKHFSLKQLLIDFGLEVSRTNMFCPFHDDEYTGKPSARYHPDTDLLYCFSESKMYYPYHALKDLHGANINEKFLEAWGAISQAEKEEILDKYGEGEGKVIDREEFLNPIWRNLKFVSGKFRQGDATFKQHRNAVYKILKMIYDEEIRNKFNTEDVEER